MKQLEVLYYLSGVPYKDAHFDSALHWSLIKAIWEPLEDYVSLERELCESMQEELS